MYVSAVSKMFLVPTCRITARPGIGHMVVSVWLFLMLRIKGISASEFPRMLPMAMAVQSSAVAVPWHGCGCGIRMPCWGRRTKPDRNSALYMDKPFPSRKHILCAYVADAVSLRDPRLTRKKLFSWCSKAIGSRQRVEAAKQARQILCIYDYIIHMYVCM